MTRRVIDALSLESNRGNGRVVRSVWLRQIHDAALIAGLVAPDSGDICIDGQVVASTGEKFVKRRNPRGFGMVFQDLALWPHMTVPGILTFGLRAQRIPAEERDRRIRESPVSWVLATI